MPGKVDQIVCKTRSKPSNEPENRICSIKKKPMKQKGEHVASGLDNNINAISLSLIIQKNKTTKGERNSLKFD